MLSKGAPVARPKRDDRRVKIIKAIGGRIGAETDIEWLHTSLTAHFGALRAARSDAPIYLLEHGLSEPDLQVVLRSTQYCLCHHRIEGSWWGLHSLPLLVAVTEIGYAYRGTGTDFWPIFAERLGEISLADRSALSHLFSRSAGRLGLATPASTPWNRAFCHIAWPVLHAILPIELHRPLVRALRDVRAHLDLSGSDAALIAPIRNRAHLSGGGRLIAWLEDQRTAAAVVRQFLDTSHQDAIANSALMRIATDLAKDEIASAALRDARKRQRALTNQPGRQSRGKISVAETRFAGLVLRSTDQGLSLALKIPQLDSVARDAARAALEAMRWRAFLWGQGRPIPSRNIFSDYPLPLSVAALPSADVALIEGADKLPLSQETREFIGSLRVNTATPILFSEFSADGDALQRSSKAVAYNSNCIVLLAQEQPPPSAESLGPVADLQAYRISVDQPESTKWLSHIGCVVRQSARLNWLGDPELEQHRPTRRFRKGCYVAFEVTGVDSHCGVHLVAPDGRQSHLAGSDRILVGFTADQIGTYDLRYGAGESTTFEVIEEDEVADLISVDIDAGAGTIGDLAERRVTLRFESEATLQEAEIELRLLCDGQESGRVRRTLPDTPCRLVGIDSIWDALLAPETIERLLLARTVVLRVVIQGLVDASFQFEHVSVPFAWHRDPAGKLTAIDETGDLTLYTVSPENPLDVMPMAEGGSGSHIALYRAGNGTPLLTGGLCAGPKYWHANDAELANPPARLIRQFEGGRGDTADARSVVEALISWSAAGVDHSVTQMRRGRVVQQLDHWLVQQLCGTEWASRESALAPRRETSFARAFLSACASLQVGYADVELTRTQRSLLDRILLRLIEARGLRIPLQASCEPIGENLGMALDYLFNDAYAILFQELKSLGESCRFDPDDDIDVGEVTDNWERGRRMASREAALGELVELLRPLEAGEILSLADFETMLSDDVIDFLHNWISNYALPHHARNWNRELVEAAYWLFAKPAVVASLSWVGATQRLLADNFSARAIRYAALRTIGGIQNCI